MGKKAGAAGGDHRSTTPSSVWLTDRDTGGSGAGRRVAAVGASVGTAEEKAANNYKHARGIEAALKGSNLAFVQRRSR